MERIERELRELIERHETAAREQYPELPDVQGFQVAVAELRNILEPGSAPMFPEQPGWGATCSTCMPQGDGVHFSRKRKRAE
jgi:hypothetical protein